MITYNLLCAVNYLHSTDVLHRDIKPSNILIQDDCSIRICDFGLSRTLLDKEAEDGDELLKKDAKLKRDFSPVVFSRWYRPPEIILCADYDSKADMWATGCVIAELALKLANDNEDIKETILFGGKACYPLSPCLNIKPKHKTIFSEIHKHD